MELDPSITEITTENIPNILIPDNNDKILITVRQPFRSTSWIWTSTKKKEEYKLDGKFLLLTSTMVEHNVWMSTKNAKMKITGENVGL